MASPVAEMLTRNALDLQRRLAPVRAAGHAVVLVPTMGDLHQGHLSLVRRAATLGRVVVSVFVNPTQFTPGEDFDSYPRDLERDLQLLAREPGLSAVFAPDVATMYPPGHDTVVEVGALAQPLCGAFRPGHFRGVCTVVAKLFGLVRPDAAVFGQKDAQQCLVLARMVEDLGMGVRLEFAPTVREPDGLAMSSRNRYLDAGQRREALRLSRALDAAQAALAAGVRETSAIEAIMAAELGPLRVDYAQARALPDLSHPDQIGPRTLLAIAAHVGRARLIDNLCLSVSPTQVAETPLLEGNR